MATRTRTSKQTLALLGALVAKPSQWHYGYALSRETELMSGTLYPILMRLEERGWFHGELSILASVAFAAATLALAAYEFVTTDY